MAVKLKIPRDYFVFVFCLYMFVFEMALANLWNGFGYWDEFYAALVVPLLILHHVPVKTNKNVFLMWLFFILFIVTALISNIFYQYQEALYVTEDAFFNAKFIFSIYTTVLLFKDFNFLKYKSRIKKHVDLIISILFILLVANKVFHIFPAVDPRFGMGSEKLIFSHPTYLASTSYILALLVTFLYEGERIDLAYLIMALLLSASTYRSKALAAVAVYVILFFWQMIFKQRLGIFIKILGGSLAVGIGWSQLYFYFFGDQSDEMSRGTLLSTGWKIAKDYFPLGTGLGTFASAPSQYNYSPVYYSYHLNTIWGLSPENPAYISDSFWPMIIGEGGYLGLVWYILYLIMVYRVFIGSVRKTPCLYMAGLGAFIYLLISSFGESAFVNPYAMFMGFLFGMIWLVKKKNVSNLDDHIFNT